ncbi:MAG: VOC family protein [Anaerolineae bacterium]|nr:VOC family protein [Thermoflexales bacterium]MDW8406163.1 VOC family protein [Anaerolineae bacterium]
MNITGADHTSFSVSNLERSLSFYTNVLGFKLLWQREITNQYFRDIVGIPDCVVKAAHLAIPNSSHKLELFEYAAPRGTPAVPKVNQPGSAHLSLYVDDLPAAYEELRAKGVQFRSPPIEIDAGANKGGWALYLLDPDGIPVELFQPPAR